MFLLESPEDAAMMVTAIMAGGGALLTLVLTIVYFSNWYTVLLAFSPHPPRAAGRGPCCSAWAPAR